MTIEELIADWKYHTCGRCRHDASPKDQYPCSACKWSGGKDLRENLWEFKEEEE